MRLESLTPGYCTMVSVDTIVEWRRARAFGVIARNTGDLR
jgi:hypothetical protein